MNIAVNAVGLHPTTELCLEALQWLHERKDIRNALDMGCGNGILSVTAAAIWPARVLAADISEKAVNDARAMADSHGLSGAVQVIRSDGFANAAIINDAPYDLICFNMLAESLISMAPHVKAYLSKDGIALISGILRWQESDVEATYKALGFEFTKQYQENPWSAYLLCHKTDTGLVPGIG